MVVVSFNQTPFFSKGCFGFSTPPPHPAPLTYIWVVPVPRCVERWYAFPHRSWPLYFLYPSFLYILLHSEHCKHATPPLSPPTLPIDLAFCFPAFLLYLPFFYFCSFLAACPILSLCLLLPLLLFSPYRFFPSLCLLLHFSFFLPIASFLLPDFCFLCYFLSPVMSFLLPAFCFLCSFLLPLGFFLLPAFCFLCYFLPPYILFPSSGLLHPLLFPSPL